MTDTSLDELPALAYKMSQALQECGVFYMRGNGIPNAAEQYAEQARQAPPERVAWRELAAVADQNATEGLELWEAIKEAARQELRSGARAWAALEASEDMPIGKARFLAVRESFLSEWQPRGGVEAALVDQLAQAHAMQQQWTETLTQRSRAQVAADLRDREGLGKKEQLFKWGEWLPERITEAEAIAEAMGMVDRWNRLFMRTLRQLRDLRRYSPVVINNPGQVNVAGQQVNLSKTEGGKGRRQAKKRRAASDRP